MKKVIIILCVVVVLAGALCWGWNNFQMAQETSSDSIIGESITGESYSGINVSVLTEKIQALGELVTVEYIYTDATTYSAASQLFGFTVPLTEKNFVIKWDGSIKAGIEFSQLKVDVDDEEKIITITMPEAHIASNEPNLDTFEVLNEKDGLFNNVTITDTMSALNEAQELMAERAIDKGLLETAESNAQTLISQFLKFDEELADYTIVYNVVSTDETESATE